MTNKNYYDILDEDGHSDYELYLQTNKILSCQKKISDLCNEDELQFQIVHQSEELLLKLLVYTLINITQYMEEKRTQRILTLFKRAYKIQRMLIDLFGLLETMSPKEYQQIRLGLGNGSGQGSPGFRGLIRIVGPLWNEYEKQYLLKENLSIEMIYDSQYQHDDAYVIAEALLEFDAMYRRFYKNHFDLIERTIGGKAKSLKGHDVERLKQRADLKLFPKLWDIRNEMTDRWGQSYGTVRDSLGKPTNDSVMPTGCPFKFSKTKE